MNFSAWSIRNPVPPTLLFFVLCALGITSFMGLPITRFPNIDIPVIAVTVVDPGAAPEALETQATKAVEDAISGVSGLKNVMSTVTEGKSTTVGEFRLEIDTDRALNDVKDAIAKIESDLPQTAEKPVIRRIDVEGQAIMTFAASAPAMTLEELSWFVDDTALRALQGVKGVGRAERMGGVSREIKVEIDPDRLAALGVTAGDVSRQLSATNLDISSGKTDAGGREQGIRVLAGAQTVRELAETSIALPGGRSVRLHELGAVVDSFEEPKSFVRVDGQPVVAISVYRAKGASDVDVKRAVQAKLAELHDKHPNVALTKIDDSVTYTYGNFTSAMHTLVEGALLAVVVVLIFLRDIRATIVAAITLPLAAIPTFWALDLLGFSMNLISLLGITLVTGILVDDAIVEIENIVRHERMGKSPYRAAMEAADEIGMAVIAISMTIIAIFAPVSFMGGIPGQYFKQFGLTVAIAVFFSLLVARLITPMLAAYFMRGTHDHGEGEGRFIRGYARFLEATLHWRWITLGVGVAIFAGSIFAMNFLPTGFMPKVDESRIVVSAELPPGALLQDTSRVTDEMARRIGEIAEVDNVMVIGGSSPTGTLETRRAALIINLVRKDDRERSQLQVEQDVATALRASPDSRFFYVNERGDRELSMNIVGDDGDAVSDAGRRIEALMGRDPLFRNPAAGASYDRPEIRVRPKMDEMAALGVTPAAIAQTIRIATQGDADSSLARFTDGTRRIPIRVRLSDAGRDDLSTLRTLRVRTGDGGATTLGAVAEIDFGETASTISRHNRERLVEIGADMAPGRTIGEGAARIKEIVAEMGLPEGVRVQESGDSEIQNDVFAGFAQAMSAGVMLVFVVLILLLGNIFMPIVILVTLPLSVVGVVLGLLLTNNSVSMPVVIGILMLMGIVTKNAIMLVDFAVERERHGMNREEAIVDAGRKRIRPIVMTTLAMAAGMMPAAMATGEGGEFRAPMAIAVIGGLLASTLLSLIMVPSVYTIMADLAGLVSRLMRWMLKPNDTDEIGEEKDHPLVLTTRIDGGETGMAAQ